MLKILRRFFAFCSMQNRKKFYMSIFLGVWKAAFEVMKFPAIFVTLRGVLNNHLTVGDMFAIFYNKIFADSKIQHTK